MKFVLWTFSLLFLLTGTLTQDLGFDLGDALDDLADPTPAKPKEQPKPPPAKPESDGGLDLLDAFGFDDELTKKPVKPVKPVDDGFGFDLDDALGPDPNPKPDKPVVKPPHSGGGGGSFDDGDLADTIEGGLKPEGGNSGGGGGYDQGGADQPQASDPGPMAAIISAVGVAVVGAASSFVAYQKKKLCFKIQGGTDPEMGKSHQGTSDNQENQSTPGGSNWMAVFSNLLRTS